MSTLHPNLRRHAWNPLFWLRVYKNRRNWRACERCGFTNECLPYGQTVRDNYAALEMDGLPQPKKVNGPENKRVCIHCCMELREAYRDMPVSWPIEHQQKGLGEG